MVSLVPLLTWPAHLQGFHIFSPEYTHFFGYFFWCIGAVEASALLAMHFSNKILWLGSG